MTEMEHLDEMFHMAAIGFGLEEFPSDYLVIDIETSGVSPTSNKITQVGLLPVVNRVAEKPISILINREPKVLDTFDWEMIKRVTGITRQRIEEEGIMNSVIFPEICSTVHYWLERGAFLAGHNLINFDIPFFNFEFATLKMDGCKFPVDRAIDTGAMVKAVQMGSRMTPGESFLQFSKRILELRRKGVFWSLDRHCIPAYGLTKYGVDASKAHDAGYDCFITHTLLEVLRRRSVKETVK